MDTSYLAQQVTTIIGQLHGLFDDIGVPSHERDTREAELFSALSETLHTQLRLVTNEKHELTEEADRLIKTIKDMEASLTDQKRTPSYGSDKGDMEVTYPLSQCLQSLKEKHDRVAKVHRERFEQVRKLVEALESYASHLEPSFVQIKLPPTSPDAQISPAFDISPSYVASLDNEFTRVYEEYTRRVAQVQLLAQEMVQLWAELGTPQAQTDTTIVKYHRDAPEQLGLHKEDIAQLKAKKDRLVEEKRARERRIAQLRTTIEELWERLGVEEHKRKQFLSKNRGCGLREINEFEDELSRLNELKRQNLHLFVEEARIKLQELWDALYFSEEEMLDFTPAFSDVCSDALLSAHEQEIARLEALKLQRLPILQKIDRHRELIKERDELQASSQDASRLMARGVKGERRDPGKLLREEKMRKRIAKELPKVEAELQKTLEQWEDEYGRPFLVLGERYLDDLYDAAAPKAPPARSKTPVAPPAKQAPKSAPRTSRANTVHGAQLGRSDSRAKTPTANFGASIRGNPLANSVMSSSVMGSTHGTLQRSQSKNSVTGSTHGTLQRSPSKNSVTASGQCTLQRSPSKIPSRGPLRTMPHGGNSPERKTLERQDSTIRKMLPPRAPPPKMKDLFIPPEPAQTPVNRLEFSRDRSESIVRHVPPEDVYDDRSYISHKLSMGYNNARYAPTIVSTRQVSHSSASSTATGHTAQSGSENWETFSEQSEDQEQDIDFHRYQMARTKRYTPEDGHGSPGGIQGKKLRGNSGIRSVDGHSMSENSSGRMMRVVEGSEAAWTDEEQY